MTSCAPARAKPAATAYPIWPTRPTPVTSATLPRKSGGTGDDLVDRRRASLREGDLPVPAHDVHAALDPLAVVLERVIGARDRALRIGQQRKIESQLPDVVGVSLQARGVHAERLHPRSVELRHLVAHGGELAVSAGCVIARIEDERDVFRLQDVGQGVGLAVGRGRRKRGCLAADAQRFAHGGDSLGVSATISRDVFPRRSSSFSSHSSGTSISPNPACESPSSMSPCQSEPPLIASPRRSASAASRRSVASEWLGCRTSSPSRPSAWNCRICPSLPPSPRCAATATPPTACTRSVTWRSVGRGFST